MDTPLATEPVPAAAWRNVIVLLIAQAVLGAQMSMVFIVGGLAGQSLAPNPCIATLPLSMVILGSTLSAQPLSRLMQAHGRKAGFMLASGAGAAGAAIAALGLWRGSFVLFCAGSALTGIYMSAQGFFRFAATDAAPPAFQPKAISYVMAGGLAAAITGPQLGRLTAEAMANPFPATHLAILGRNRPCAP